MSAPIQDFFGAKEVGWLKDGPELMENFKVVPARPDAEYEASVAINEGMDNDLPPDKTCTQMGSGEEGYIARRTRRNTPC